MRRLLVTALIGVALVAVGGVGGAALATPKLHVLSKACVATSSRALTAPTKGKCPKGSLLEQVGTATRGRTGATGASGAAGAPGPQGPQGPQGPAGAPASSKTYIVNWTWGSPAGHIVNGTPGIAVKYDDEGTTNTEIVGLAFPVAITSCGVSVSVVGQRGDYAPYSGTPQLEAARASDPSLLQVRSLWLGGSGTDWSLVVSCP